MYVCPLFPVIIKNKKLILIIIIKNKKYIIKFIKITFIKSSYTINIVYNFIIVDSFLLQVVN